MTICSVCRKDLTTHWRCMRCSVTGCGEIKRSTSDKSLCADCHDDLTRRGQQRCRSCDAIKPLTDFSKTNQVCRACRKIERAARYLRHREQELENAHRYRAEHREQQEATRRAYVETYRERRRETERKRWANSEKHRQYRREYQRRWRSRPDVKARKQASDRRYQQQQKLRILAEIQGKRQP